MTELAKVLPNQVLTITSNKSIGRKNAIEQTFPDTRRFRYNLDCYADLRGIATNIKAPISGTD